MSKWALEIEYTFQKDKTDKKQTSWFYFWSDAVKYETAVSHAEKHFKTLLTNSGWTRYTKLVAIRPITDASKSPSVVSVTPDPPAKPKPRRSSGSNTRTATKTNSGAKQNAPSPSKPKANRKPSKSTQPTTTSATSRGRGGKGKTK